MTRRDFPHLLLGLVTLLVTLSACKSNEVERVAFMQMRAAGDHLLLVGHVPDELTGHRMMGRVALVDDEGVIRHALDERTVFAVEGVTDEVIWLTRKTPTGDLSAHRLTDLAPIPAARQALAAHPTLSVTCDVLGTRGDDAIVKAANGRHFAVSPTGEITKLTGEVDYEPPPPTKGGKRDLVPVPGQPIPKGDEERARAIADGFDNAYMLSQTLDVLGKKTRDILILSTTPSQGGVARQLSRVGPGGKVRWTTPLADLAAPVRLQNAQVELVAITPLGDATWMLLRAATAERYMQEDYYEVEHRLVRLDPKTGRAAESHRIRER